MTRVAIPALKDGKLVKEYGEMVTVVEQKEPWSEYRLEDGTLIRTKQTLMQIVKMDTPGPDGKPVYTMQTQPTIMVIPNIENE